MGRAVGPDGLSGDVPSVDRAWLGWRGSRAGHIDEFDGGTAAVQDAALVAARWARCLLAIVELHVERSEMRRERERPQMFEQRPRQEIGPSVGEGHERNSAPRGVALRVMRSPGASVPQTPVVRLISPGWSGAAWPLQADSHAEYRRP